MDRNAEASLESARRRDRCKRALGDGGNYGGTLALRMARADTIIFLDVSRWASLAGVLSRRARTNQREDMTDCCPERVNLTFLWLWRYHDHHRPGVLEQIGAHAGEP